MAVRSGADPGRAGIIAGLAVIYRGHVFGTKAPFLGDTLRVWVGGQHFARGTECIGVAEGEMRHDDNADAQD